MSSSSFDDDPPVRHDRGSRTSVVSILGQLDRARLTVTEGGKRRQMPSIEVQYKRFFNKAINGELPAIRMILRLAQDCGLVNDSRPPSRSARRVKVMVGNGVSEWESKPERVPAKRDGDYSIGYRRPPKEKRYKSGQTGNPNGRPKRAEGETYHGEVFRRVAFNKIELQADDGPKQICRMEAVMRKLQAMSHEGNTQAGNLLNKLRKMAPVPASRLAPIVIWISEDDAKV